jgi:hypothetical protein
VGFDSHTEGSPTGAYAALLFHAQVIATRLDVTILQRLFDYDDPESMVQECENGWQLPDEGLHVKEVEFVGDVVASVVVQKGGSTIRFGAVAPSSGQIPPNASAAPSSTTVLPATKAVSSVDVVKPIGDAVVVSDAASQPAVPTSAAAVDASLAAPPNEVPAPRSDNAARTDVQVGLPDGSSRPAVSPPAGKAAGGTKSPKSVATKAGRLVKPSEKVLDTQDENAELLDDVQVSRSAVVMHAGVYRPIRSCLLIPAGRHVRQNRVRTQTPHRRRRQGRRLAGKSLFVDVGASRTAHEPNRLFRAAPAGQQTPEGTQIRDRSFPGRSPGRGP